MMLRYCICFGLATVVMPCMSLAQTTIDSTWDGTTGDWATSNGWDVLGTGDSYPDNNTSYVYNVTLPGGAYVLSSVVAAEVDDVLGLGGDRAGGGVLGLHSAP